jgi:acetoin utilization protein AcuB
MIAADIMTKNPRTVPASATVAEAVDLLQSMNVRHLPVVDDAGHLVGMLSDRDLGPLVRIFTEGAEAERMLALSQRQVSELMSGDVVTVEPDTDVREVIDDLLEERIGAVPVVSGPDDVVGIVSYVDVLRALAELAV